MQNLLPLILIGFFIYRIFSRKGGMGCCGGHGAHEPKRHQDGRSDDLNPENRTEQVIDLRRDEYTVLSSNNDQGILEHKNLKEPL